MTYDDDSVKQLLTEIDNDETITVSQWEADFLETVLFKQTFPLTVNQTRCALNIIEKYGKDT